MLISKVKYAEHSTKHKQNMFVMREFSGEGFIISSINPSNSSPFGYFSSDVIAHITTDAPVPLAVLEAIFEMTDGREPMHSEIFRISQHNSADYIKRHFAAGLKSKVVESLRAVGINLDAKGHHHIAALVVRSSLDIPMGVVAELTENALRDRGSRISVGVDSINGSRRYYSENSVFYEENRKASDSRQLIISLTADFSEDYATKSREFARSLFSIINVALARSQKQVMTSMIDETEFYSKKFILRVSSEYLPPEHKDNSNRNSFDASSRHGAICAATRTARGVAFRRDELCAYLKHKSVTVNRTTPFLVSSNRYGYSTLVSQLLLVKKTGSKEPESSRRFDINFCLCAAELGANVLKTSISGYPISDFSLLNLGSVDRLNLRKKGRLMMVNGTSQDYFPPALQVYLRLCDILDYLPAYKSIISSALEDFENTVITIY
jgi:hypothetical protein